MAVLIPRMLGGFKVLLCEVNNWLLQLTTNCHLSLQLHLTHIWIM